MTTKARIQSRLKRSKRYVFTRDDFKDIAGYDQIGRALRALVKEGVLLKVGYGVYTKARRNSITGKLMPASPGGSAAVIVETLDRLKVRYRVTDATRAYNSGKSTQIPVSAGIKTSSRFKRVLSVGNSKLNG
ncbi:S-adenosylhomocysteine hydrolase [Salmonella enterica subsp. enterica serovar Panama]|uniref:S-adenosylhomocysteine hydrolase n=1 Tax=Salmonella enterica subsp. enterica serovar Panama TaxID=29472 RepID=A0A752DP49_SALET|nr:S-adenosylhomocysteine hydrolase [Salmonella enterica subsp. enterica serovar Sandiego]EBR3742661.1 S-adenosylhomocysteine hydrolase [Salmonella enterica]ECI5747619.1 S-adenosylhomocysteine hydrolase [Salmonella enterica subsp. enterica]ECW6488428.1 S-adenosylhomocysteine hydrolase [Salmonella enterica subsp. enterica serovar Rubislaw]EDQ2493226.1 S-adenosylhomocysteine hydrolase [Salmonella enterica subsp. enterica serovar Bonariensis]EEA7823380.1 S-adenosylhomocysteine hydrolase [Salmonel